MTGRTNLEQGQSYIPQFEFVLPLNSNEDIGFNSLNVATKKY